MAGQLRHRTGDQKLPVPNDGPSMHDLVCADLEGWPAPRSEIEAVRDLLLERKRLGIERYGSILQPNNGRDFRRDLVEELADALVYARQGLEELGDAEEAYGLSRTYRRILSALFWLQKFPEAAP